MKRLLLVERKVGVANTVTWLGFAAGMGWAVGGPAWMAAVSIIADEVDGYVARALGEKSKLGYELDYTADMVLMGAASLRLGGLWPLAAAVYMPFAAKDHAEHGAVYFGSMRAIMMSYGIARKS